MDRNISNLQEAFAGESQAHHRYLAFAAQADQDRLPNVARLFRAAAQAETIHALGHLKAMEGVATTAANLRQSICGETAEFTEMYPAMLAQAEADGHKAKRMFGLAMKAEEVHAGLYQAALAVVEDGNDLAEAGVFLCPVCGYIEFGQAPDRCPICATPGARFIAQA